MRRSRVTGWRAATMFTMYLAVIAHGLLYIDTAHTSTRQQSSAGCLALSHIVLRTWMGTL